jgi:hypothetical protein
MIEIARAMVETAVGMTEMAVAGMTETACWRRHWFVSSVSETRIIWNITPDI